MFRTLLAAASVLVLSSGAAPAWAQSATGQAEPPIRRLDRLDRAVRELNAIVRQGAATGRPVTVAPETLPADLDALHRRLDDLEAVQRTQTSTIESLTGDLNTARRTAGEAQAQVRDLQTRIATMESAQAQAALTPPPSPPAEAEAADESAPAPAAAGGRPCGRRIRAGPGRRGRTPGRAGGGLPARAPAAAGGRLRFGVGRLRRLRRPVPEGR